jgi:ABC-type multidrug transport system fused ATPase/permease subunit
MLRNPSIIIMDEPTSALDSIAEKHVTDALQNLTKDKSVIIIAHRLQTVMHADQIIVMEAGRIIQTGTHDSLISQG